MGAGGGRVEAGAGSMGMWGFKLQLFNMCNRSLTCNCRNTGPETNPVELWLSQRRQGGLHYVGGCPCNRTAHCRPSCPALSPPILCNRIRFTHASVRASVFKGGAPARQLRAAEKKPKAARALLHEPAALLLLLLLPPPAAAAAAAPAGGAAPPAAAPPPPPPPAALGPSGVHDHGFLQQHAHGVRGLRANGEPLLDGGGVEVGLLLEGVVPPQVLRGRR